MYYVTNNERNLTVDTFKTVKEAKEYIKSIYVGANTSGEIFRGNRLYCLYHKYDRAVRVGRNYSFVKYESVR